MQSVLADVESRTSAASVAAVGLQEVREASHDYSCVGRSARVLLTCMLSWLIDASNDGQAGTAEVGGGERGHT
eukprot:SAG31_NODE_8256_length_1487_cov_3.587642_2_plen_73_part_00